MLAEESLATVSQRLIEAQEQERKRIAGELHDDICQRIALLALGLDQLQQGSPEWPAEVRNRTDELRKQATEVATDLQSLSHELHSSRLELLGVAVSMRAFCKEFGDKHKVKIDFSSEGIPSGVPPKISVALFRVMQEALHNALKHSGVRSFEVRLHGSPAEIHLTVRDLGVGFEPELAKGTPGLGLISMRERIRLVKGTISITSKTQSGTEINVCVPLSADLQAEQAKGTGA